MRIDFSSYYAFWKNPAEYRIGWKAGLQPADQREYMALGKMFHLLIEKHHKGWDIAELEKHAKEANCDQFMEKALILYYAASNYRRDIPVKTLESELEWEWQIPGSRHSMVGKIDEINDIYGTAIPSDWKTMSERGTVDMAIKEIKDEWETSITGAQGMFGLIGAASKGYVVDGRFNVYAVMTGIRKKPTKKNPNPEFEYSSDPKVFCIQFMYTNAQIESLIAAVDDTCDIIELLQQRSVVRLTRGPASCNRSGAVTSAGRTNANCVRYHNL